MNDSLIGQNLDGYLIEELLGHGGMGRVYRALDDSLNRYAAIKILDVQGRDPDSYQQRFNREAQSIAKLRHQNIVAIYRFKKVNDIFYMAMEYIDGADLRWVLRDYLADDELMDYDTVLSIISQIASALDYSHKNGVIHRDIKPPNIMIARDGTAYLTDFGLALNTAEGSIGEIFGSPHYIAPEQAINSADAVPQTDIYALGVILFEMLTGAIPYQDGSIIEVAMSHIHEPIPDPRKFNPELHETFVPIIQKVLAKDPKDRYQTGEALIKDLKSAIRTVEQTQPTRVYSTLSKPAERIAQNISPLRPPTALKDIKPPTRIENSSSTNVLSDEKSTTKKESTDTQKATLQPEAQAPISKENSSGRNPLAILIPILIIIALGLGGLYYVSPETFSNFLGDTNLLSNPSTLASIEGRVTDIQINNRILIIYDMPIQIDENHNIWDEVATGDIVSIKGEASQTDIALRFDTISEITRNGVSLKEEQE